MSLVIAILISLFISIFISTVDVDIANASQGLAFQESRAAAAAYDRQRPHFTSIEQIKLATCSDEISDRECSRLKQRRFYIADRPSFLALSYFEKGALGDEWLQAKKLFINGRLQIRKSNVYEDSEMHSSHDAFVVAMGRYLQDPEYGCLSAADSFSRRPAAAWYLHRHFQTTATAPECLSHQKLPFRILDYGTTDVTKIAAEDVLQVHVAWVSSGIDFLSQWGHLFIILVTHDGRNIALNFHSNPNGHAYDNGNKLFAKLWDGLTGNHVALLIPSLMQSQIEGYVKSDKRFIRSIQLNLSDVQKAQLLFSAFEGSAYYRGIWRHLSRNCVSHILDLLLVALDEPALENRPEGILTPAAAVDYIRKTLPQYIVAKPERIWD
jgi:hypothetical protein